MVLWGGRVCACVCGTLACDVEYEVCSGRRLLRMLGFCLRIVDLFVGNHPNPVGMRAFSAGLADSAPTAARVSVSRAK